MSAAAAEVMVGPHEYETSVHFQRGWAAGSIVSAIVELTGLLADEQALAVRDEDDWDRRYATTKARVTVRQMVESLRTALDVLDPTGTCSSRERLPEVSGGC